MKLLLLVGVAASLLTGVIRAQEERVPDDSALVSIQGCARGSMFTVGPRREDQPATLAIEPGSRFRLNGPKKLLDEIKRRERNVVEVTGLIRKADLDGPRGLPVFGGRVRIGGARPQDPIANPGRDPSYSQPVMDVRAWRPLTGDCRR